MIITGTLISYYIYCKRRLWLHANGIRMEQTSDTVSEGKLLGETSYPQRAEKYTEIELSYDLENKYQLACKIDFYDAKNKVIHEVKKSDSKEIGNEWQVKFYLWMLELNMIKGATGIIEYVIFRETKEVTLSADDIIQLEQMCIEIEHIVNNELCLGKIELKYCKKCAYYDFCYINES